MRGEVEAGKRVIEGQKLFLVEKEREWQAKHSRATQNHLREIATLEQEKLDLLFWNFTEHAHRVLLVFLGITQN